MNMNYRKINAIDGNFFGIILLLYLVDGVWSFGGESSGVLGGLGHDSSWEWEFDVWIVHLFVLWSSALVRFDLFGSENLDRTWSSSMSSGHFSIHLGDGEWERNISVLSVHVLTGTSGVVPDPDAVVLDGVWGKDLLSEQFWVWFHGGWKFSPDDGVLLEI